MGVPGISGGVWAHFLSCIVMTGRGDATGHRARCTIRGGRCGAMMALDRRSAASMAAGAATSRCAGFSRGGKTCLFYSKEALELHNEARGVSRSGHPARRRICRRAPRFASQCATALPARAIARLAVQRAHHHRLCCRAARSAAAKGLAAAVSAAAVAAAAEDASVASACSSHCGASWSLASPPPPHPAAPRAGASAGASAFEAAKASKASEASIASSLAPQGGV